jgi:N-ethylmaleimide reductase
VGFRISPRGNFNGMHDSDPLALYSQLVAALNDIPLAYLHLIEPLPGHPTFTSQEEVPRWPPNFARSIRAP